MCAAADQPSPTMQESKQHTAEIEGDQGACLPHEAGHGPHLVVVQVVACGGWHTTGQKKLDVVFHHWPGMQNWIGKRDP